MPLGKHVKSSYLVALLAVCALPGLSSCSKAPKAVTPAATTSQSDLVSTFTLVGHADNGRKKWEIQGETADLMAQVVHLSPVKAKAFGQTEITLTARDGWFHRESQDVELKTDVVVTTSDGAKLTTETFHWTGTRQTGKTSDWVTVTQPGMRVVGKGGFTHPKFKRVRLEREVTVTLTDRTGETVITCDGPMEVDYGRSKARFWRGVLVKDQKGTIRSDRMDVTLDPKTKQLDKASFFGHVTIHHENQSGFSHRANYWQSPGRTQLIGHPKLVMLPEDERWRE